MELYPKESGPCVDFSWPVYVGTESISTLQQMVFEDIQCGDINERYRYEYRHNEEFAKKFGTTVKAGLAKFQDDLDASRRAMFFNCKPIICSSKTTGCRRGEVTISVVGYKAIEPPRNPRASLLLGYFFALYIHFYTLNLNSTMSPSCIT